MAEFAPEEEMAGEKVTGNVTHVLFPDHVRQLRRTGAWCAL